MMLADAVLALVLLLNDWCWEVHRTRVRFTVYCCENALFQREMKSATCDWHYKSHPVALVGPDKRK